MQAHTHLTFAFMFDLTILQSHLVFTTTFNLTTLQVPLVFCGAYFGYKQPQVNFPTKTNLIPRFVPPCSWYLQPIFCILVGGVLPFGAVFIELFFILSSVELYDGFPHVHA